ncbi:hypothetical protein LEMLEM_LOCUS17712 [Lemmus lemmus]
MLAIEHAFSGDLKSEGALIEGIGYELSASAPASCHAPYHDCISGYELSASAPASCHAPYHDCHGL